ncbi:DUF805 domain-containing protein [Parvularcula oceani]|uniref:DUF805 domain-containing protein n=1 Tax=Parvularcula oceani TaxID=1247963 RepID=UPI0004E1F71D|nr:DUF805 domain-containing protein [Parvularcula oceani]
MFDFLFNPRGRISRKGMWLGFFLPYFLISVGLGALGEAAPVFGVLSTVVGIFYLWPSTIAVPMKRLHDHGKSGRWLLGYYAVTLVLTVFVGIEFGQVLRDAGVSAEGVMTPTEQRALFVEHYPQVLRTGLGLLSTVAIIALVLFFFVYLYVVPGERADNRYGRDPQADGRGLAD